MTVRVGAPARAAALGAHPAVRPTLSTRARHVLAGWLLVAPLAAFLAAAFYYPLIYTLRQSVNPSHGTGWTLAQYVGFLGSREGLGVLGLTLGLSFAATAFSVLLSLPLALFLRRRFFGRRTLQFLMMLPITIPALVGALGLVILYDAPAGSTWCCCGFICCRVRW